MIISWLGANLTLIFLLDQLHLPFDVGTDFGAPNMVGTTSSPLAYFEFLSLSLTLVKAQIHLGTMPFTSFK